jgi:purine-nucleoside phosphorylase
VIGYSEPDCRLLEIAAKAFPEGNKLPIVTTDAVYRQTFHKEALWREKGAVGVDMETSAVFSISRLKGIEAVMVMIVSDVHPLSPEEKTDWKWHMPMERRAEFGERCLKLAMEV